MTRMRRAGVATAPALPVIPSPAVPSPAVPAAHGR